MRHRAGGSSRGVMTQAAVLVGSSLAASFLVVGVMLAPDMLLVKGNHREARTELVSLPPSRQRTQMAFRSSDSRTPVTRGDIRLPPFADDLSSYSTRGRNNRFGGAFPPKGVTGKIGKEAKHGVRSSLALGLPPGQLPYLPPHDLPRPAAPPPTKNYENVRYHKVPTGEVAYFGEGRYGQWFAEHKHKAAEGEINTYPSGCTSGCDLRQSRMLEAAEGLVKVALDTHESLETAYQEQKDRNEAWAKRIQEMLNTMVPADEAPFSGVCHSTVDCEDCHDAGITEEALCRQKLGIWIPSVSVIKNARQEAEVQDAAAEAMVSPRFRRFGFLSLLTL